ncbi:sigma factor-like helix-turn-helix DNA-binding protein [Lysobacter sp. CA199]|uniref:sigma factor-like helix-turn-helix DNA-binding protein n=1 Tax=Lysobacter sp. CA199 TaxID=3455608 RepID=UPI003F8D26E9
MTTSELSASSAETGSNVDRIWSEFMVTLDALPPQVRAAFLLHEVFEAGYDDIARLIGQPTQVCRDHVDQARALALSRMLPLCRPAKAVAR